MLWIVLMCEGDKKGDQVPLCLNLIKSLVWGSYSGSQIPSGIWQYLETFFIVVTGKRHLVGRG